MAVLQYKVFFPMERNNIRLIEEGKGAAGDAQAWKGEEERNRSKK